VTVLASLAFDPPDIRVSPGATVTWTWAASNTEDHNVVFAEPSITDSGVQSSGSYSTAMPVAPGTYEYECQFHAGMEGSVLVQ
jgi:plastocyanin